LLSNSAPTPAAAPKCSSAFAISPLRRATTPKLLLTSATPALIPLAFSKEALAPAKSPFA